MSALFRVAPERAAENTSCTVDDAARLKRSDGSEPKPQCKSHSRNVVQPPIGVTVVAVRSMVGREDLRAGDCEKLGWVATGDVSLLNFRGSILGSPTCNPNRVKPEDGDGVGTLSAFA